jgi:putative sigma-54 modulation protein
MRHAACQPDKGFHFRARPGAESFAFQPRHEHSEFAFHAPVPPAARHRATLFPHRVKTGGSFMNLTISGHHLEVTPALRNYVTTKLDRITRHFDQIVDIRVLLTVEKQKEKERRQRAECMIHVKGNDVFAESSHHDLYAALDELVDKLDRQVGKHKTRLQDHHHDAPKRVM